MAEEEWLEEVREHGSEVQLVGDEDSQSEESETDAEGDDPGAE